MKVETMTAVGSASSALQGGPQSESQDPAAVGVRRIRPVLANEAAQDFALAMRRVEAECYDTL